MFIKTDNRLINLKNVSNINILRGDNRNRIIFNMNYNIEIREGKHISDYVYWDAENVQDLVKKIQKLHKYDYFNDYFIKQIDDKGFINVNEISSIKFAEKKNRVIFNLSHPITFKDFSGCTKLTSEFVYVNCSTFDKYKKYTEYIKNKLGEY